FTRATLPAELAFAPAAGGGGFSFTASSLHVLSQGGQQPPTAEEDWRPITSNTEPGVVAVQVLRLRVANPASYATGQGVTLTISDAANAYAGQLVLANIDHGPTYTFEVRTYSAASSATPINIVQFSYNKQTPPAYQYIDLLDRALQFGQVLAAAAAPYRLDLTRQGMVADYARAYTAQAAGGTAQVGTLGTPVVPAAGAAFASLPGGSLVLTSRNQQLPARSYVLEYGAILVVQPDGASMAAAPAFSVAQVAGQVRIAWVVPGLTGSAGSVAGPPGAQVALVPAGRQVDLHATAPCVKFTLATAHGRVWSAHWADALAAALPSNTPGPSPFAPPANCAPPAGCTPAPGLAAPTTQVQYHACFTATTATLLVYGLNTSNAPVVDDVAVDLRAGAVLAMPHATGSG
ncbi:MAG TPA: hypothetical protein VHI93_02815, partial [Candidatus Thermoplasmatota archaeon]|nr:hypothetical protein [Candidatus Thermoplasmatota archaeon]